MINKNELFKVPNLLCYLRILLIPVYLYYYFNHNYLLAAIIIVASGLTDFLDGYIARHFNQISNLGKILDPIADKMTQITLAISLSITNHIMAILVVLLLIKDSYMAVMSLILLRKNKKLDGALMYGKICTFVLYIIMIIIILSPALDPTILKVLIALSVGVVLYALIMYGVVFTKMYKDSL